MAFALTISLWGCRNAPSAETESGKNPTAAAPTFPSVPTKPDAPTEPESCVHAPEITQTIPATCMKPGQVISSCPLCGQTFTEETPALEHDFTAANCTEAPMCKHCGLVSGSALGHVYTNGVCIHCGHELPQDVPADCSHDYVLTEHLTPTCTTSGRMDYKCAKCDHTYSQPLDPTGHRFSDATCTEARICKACGIENGQALGHSYQDGICTRCGAEDPQSPKEVTFTVTIRSDKGAAVEGIDVSVFTEGDAPAATGKTNSKGVATMTLLSAESYRVVLSNIPSGLSAKESYTFKSTRVNINLSTVSIISPTDHSQANYKVGSTMGDFTLTDTDGITYNLSQLLKEKDLVILNFWFVNCGPCKAEFPYFEAINEKYDNVQLLTLNHIDKEADILALREQMGVTFPMIIENIGFQQGFNIQAYPTTVFIAPSGKILKIQLGDFKSQAQLEALIESLL